VTRSENYALEKVECPVCGSQPLGSPELRAEPRRRLARELAELCEEHRQKGMELQDAERAVVTA
jgi:hypothetical protein